MKVFLNKVQQKKGAPNATDGKPAGGESNVRVDISLPKTQRRYNMDSNVISHRFFAFLMRSNEAYYFNS